MKSLEPNVEPNKGFRFDYYSKSPKPFVGRVSGKTFTIRPVFSGRNSFIPYIDGRVDDEDRNTKVTLTFRLNNFVALLLSLLVCFMVFAVVKYNEPGGLLFILYTYCITIGFFNFEYRKAKVSLHKILESSSEIFVS